MTDIEKAECGITLEEAKRIAKYLLNDSDVHSFIARQFKHRGHYTNGFTFSPEFVMHTLQFCDYDDEGVKKLWNSFNGSSIWMWEFIVAYLDISMDERYKINNGRSALVGEIGASWFFNQIVPGLGFAVKKAIQKDAPNYHENKVRRLKSLF